MDAAGWYFLFELLFESLIGYIVYAMVCVPFVTWAGLATFRATAASARGYPGHGVTFWFLALPAAVIAYGVIRGYSVESAENPYARDEWGQILFALTMPAVGSIIGYAVGQITGSSERQRI